MERLVNCNIDVHIEMIKSISGGAGEFEILFSTEYGESPTCKKYKLIFRMVRDLRWSTELMSVARGEQFLKRPEGHTDNCIFIVENSRFITPLIDDLVGSKINKIKHYFLHDWFDTVIDILALVEPELVEVE